MKFLKLLGFKFKRTDEYECLVGRNLFTVQLWIMVLGLSFGVYTGCNPSPDPVPTPDPTPDEIEVQAPEFNDDEAILAYAVAKATGNASPTPPSPDNDDEVKVGDVCPVCNGRGKSGDGIQPCAPCGADGKVDNGDPILSSLASDHSIVVQYIRQDEFNELINKFTDELAQSAARLDEIDARLDALENLPEPEEPEPPADDPSPPQETSSGYRINYQGSYYVWSESERAFIASDGRRISFTVDGGINIAVTPQVRICFDGGCETCLVERF